MKGLPIKKLNKGVLNLCLPSFCADNRLCRILLLYIPGCSWQWLPAALLLLLYVPFKTLFQRGTDSENSLYSNDSLISCFLAFVVFATEMCVQILIKRWLSLYCLFPLTVPLDWTPANRAIYFPLSSFFSFFRCKNQFKDFLVRCCKSLLISVFIWEAARAGNTVLYFINIEDFLWTYLTPPKKQTLKYTEWLKTYIIIAWKNWLVGFIWTHNQKHYALLNFLKHKGKTGVTFLLFGTRTKSFVNDSFACKSIKFTMTGTPSCLLQQQPKIFDLHFLGYMQNGAIYHEPKNLSTLINYN